MLQEYPDQDLGYYLSPNEEILSRTDLHYIGGGSDKVYIVLAIHRKQTGDYRCLALYGRRGARLTQSDQGTFTSEIQASNKAVNVISQKMNKGYNKVGQQLAGMPSQNTQGTPKGLNPTPEMYNLSKFKPGTVNTLDPVKNKQKIKNILNSAVNIIEPYDELANGNTGFYYVTFDISAQLKTKGWQIFRSDDLSHAFSEEEIPESATYAIQQLGTVFTAYRTHDDKLALFDIYYLGETNKSLVNEPWKARRTIMTEVMAQLFPSRDPYDRQCFVHLNDYIYEDKEDYVQKHPGAYIDRHIDTTVKAAAHFMRL